jgi:hypothetical protein
MSDRDKSMDEINSANEQADYYLNEIIEGLIPEIDELRPALRSEIKFRLAGAFYNGVDWYREQLEGEKA